MEYFMTIIHMASVGRLDTQFSLISRIMLAAEEIINTSRQVTRTQSLASMFYWRVMFVERVGQNVRKSCKISEVVQQSETGAARYA